MSEPSEDIEIERDATPLVTIRGRFYRAVDPDFEDHALAGSRTAGRYSPPDRATLYLSSSPDGVAAAMIAHTDERVPDLRVLAFDVEAHHVADLRDTAAMATLGVDPSDAAADWQADVAAGRTPRPWTVRERLERAGAAGLIDPSRKRPGLWHLTLFSWNVDASATVRWVSD
jgi:RES domain-containing protein